MVLESWRAEVGGVATLCSLGLYLVGAHLCRGYYVARTTGHSSALSFLVGALMTLVWWTYGRLVGDATLQTVNGTGCLLQTAYIAVFYSLSPARQQTGRRILLTLLLAGLLAAYVHSQEDQVALQRGLGWLGSAMFVAYCCAPLAGLREVVRSRSSASLPLPLIVATWLATGLWATYGHIIADTFVLVPNVLGWLVASLQLVLYAWFYSGKEYRSLGMDV